MHMAHKLHTMLSMNASNTTKQVGSFKIENGSFYGPTDYMAAKGNAKLDEILAGQSASFNMTCHLSPDIETAILVAMQTDYAGWKGMQRTFVELRSVK